MKIHVLFGQRKENYTGEYGPEVLLAWDEFLVDENPDRFADEIEEQKKAHASDMLAMRLIVLEVDYDQIRKLLVEAPIVTATVVET